MGERNAERCLREALAIYRPGHVITSGFAGGLNPELDREMVVFSADTNFPLAPLLLGAGAQPVQFHCATKVVVTATQKARLWATTGCDAVEMESRIVREVCREHHIPSATVRVITDDAAEDLPIDFNQFLTSELKLDFAELLCAIAKRPRRLLALTRFHRQVQSASTALARVLAQVTGVQAHRPG